jgi:hypothetical protein
MAIGRKIWPVSGDPLRRNPSRAARPRPAEPGFERWMWYFTRISGLLLVLLAMGHMLIMHVLVQLTGQEINFAFVTSRWESLLADLRPAPARAGAGPRREWGAHHRG